MESWGIVEACRTAAGSGNLFAWIVVKGICDWDYLKHIYHQPFAARAAADLVYQVLSAPELLRAWEVCLLCCYCQVVYACWLESS